jgi:hypothetical protein
MAQVSIFEPFGSFFQFGHTGIDPPGLDLPVTADRARHGDIVRDGCECERFVAPLESTLEIALLNTGRSHTPPADRLEPKILEGAALLSPMSSKPNAEAIAAASRQCSIATSGRPPVRL